MELPEHKDRNYVGEKDVCEICPICNGDTSNLALTNWLETFEICNCDKYDDPGHLVKVTWHRDCYNKNLTNKD